MFIDLKSMGYACVVGVAAGAFMLLAAPQVASAEEAVAKALDEVTVTARRREESLREVPIAVSAYSGEMLEEIGAVDVTALSSYTPNVNLEVSRATNTTLTAYIRGVGQQDPVAGWEGGVGIYLDDVYLARPQGTVFDIYDVERIEVLRGPQGTLYGRNTIGGAVRYVTKRLSDEREFRVKAALGTYNQADLIVSGSTPVTDSFRIGGSIASFNHDGWGDNLFTGEQNADKEIMAYRLTMEWEPTDALFVRLHGDYSQDDSSARQGHRLLPAVTGEPVLPEVFDTRAGISTFPSSTGGLSPETTQGGVALEIEWDINDSLQLKSITSSRSDYTESWIDFDNLPGNYFDAPVIYDNEQFSQEFQFTYTGDRLSGIFGLYYLDANAFDAFDVIFNNALTPFTLGDYDTKALAAFFDLTYDINEQWNVSVGGRYTEDERTAYVVRETFLGLGSPYFGNTTAISLTPTTEYVPEFNGNRTDSEFTPRVSVGYAVTESHNLYLSYSEGFKGGGFDPRGAYNVAATRAGFAPESVESFEIGAKSLWADGRFVTNIAAFTMDYTNVQVPGSILLDDDGDGEPDGFAGKVTNAGKAEVSGLEIEAVAHLTDELTATVALGFIDAEYTEWLEARVDPISGLPILVDISDSRVFQNTPDTTANLRLRYETPVESGSFAVIGSVSYRSESHQFEIADPRVDQGAFSLIDLSFVWSSSDGRYEAGAHFRNLTDEQYIAASYDFSAVNNSLIGFYGPPRTISGTFAMNFK